RYPLWPARRFLRVHLITAVAYLNETVGPMCPLSGNNGHWACPLYSQKQTSPPLIMADGAGDSLLNYYSMISSALTSTVGGILRPSAFAVFRVAPWALKKWFLV